MPLLYHGVQGMQQGGKPDLEKIYSRNTETTKYWRIH